MSRVLISDELLVGKKFGKLTAMGLTRKPNFKGHTRTYYECLCECGKRTLTAKSNLLRATSCGCVARNKTALRQSRHGEAVHGSETREYNIWKGIIWRCNYKHSKSYRNYGGRGIQVCPRWNDYLLFLEDMGRCPSVHHSIDRLDNNGDYCKENCKWSTRSEQSRNKRCNIRITINGKTLIAADWDKRMGFSKGSVSHRISRMGYSPEEAVLKPSGMRIRTFRRMIREQTENNHDSKL